MAPPEQDPLTIPVGAGGEGDNSMPAQLFDSLHEQQMARLGNIANAAHENFEQVRLFAQLDYMEGKRLVSLEEAMGVREVASKQVPAGPTSTG